jgi:hypothetical protein
MSHANASSALSNLRLLCPPNLDPSTDLYR